MSDTIRDKTGPSKASPSKSPTSSTSPSNQPNQTNSSSLVPAPHLTIQTEANRSTTTKAQSNNSNRVRNVSRFQYLWLLLIGLALIPAAVAGASWLQSDDLADENVLTYTVAKRKLIDTVIERGTLESQSKVDGVCELHGWQNKITFIVEEGTMVEEGDVVVRFDASEIQQEVNQQKVAVNNDQAAVDEAREQIEVQKNKNESDIAAARLEKELADLDLEKYKEGDYKAELAELERSIAESKAALEQRKEALKNMRILVKKGYREPERLKEMEQAVKSAEFQVDRDVQKKQVLVDYTYKRQITELKSKAEEAARKLDRAQKTADAELSKAKLKLASAKERLKIEKDELREEEEQLEKTEIKAAHAGTVAYANHRWMDPQFKIRPGGNVHRRQTVFHLPDMSKMQVQLDVHESLINKLDVGQRAIVRVDSFPDQKFSGHVKKIADLARSDGNTEAKKYTAIVIIDDFPEEFKLKPGMTAEVEIHIRTLDSVMAVPVQSVTQIAGQEFVYVKRGKKYERSPVSITEGNESFLIASEGIDEGTILAMDAYQRGLNDIESEGLEGSSDSISEFEDSPVAVTSSDSEDSDLSEAAKTPESDDGNDVAEVSEPDQDQTSDEKTSDADENQIETDSSETEEDSESKAATLPTQDEPKADNDAS